MTPTSLLMEARAGSWLECSMRASGSGSWLGVWMRDKLFGLRLVEIFLRAVIVVLRATKIKSAATGWRGTGPVRVPRTIYCGIDRNASRPFRFSSVLLFRTAFVAPHLRFAVSRSCCFKILARLSVLNPVGPIANGVIVAPSIRIATDALLRYRS